jgi:hypothetical protein
VTVTSGMVSREELDDLLREYYLPSIPMHQFCRLLLNFLCSQNDTLHSNENYFGARSGICHSRAFSTLQNLLTAHLRNKCKPIPSAGETWKLSSKLLSMTCVRRRLRPLAPDIIFIFNHFFFCCLLQHALFSHHDRGASSSPFDPKNVHSSHSHEVICKFAFFLSRSLLPFLVQS